jgi:Peptidoglycan-binding protein, CsiV
MNKFTKLIIALALIPTISTATEKTPEDIDWYQVEVIIFSQQDLFNQERHVADIELTYPKNIRELIDPSANTESKLLPQHSLPIRVGTPATQNTRPSKGPFVEGSFLILPEDTLGMTPDHKRLKRAPGYRVLYHKAWRQPGLDRTKSPWIFVKGGDIFGNHHELEGSIRLVRNRYLHIQANLWKTKFKEPTSPTLVNEVSQNTEFSNSNTLTNLPMWPALPDTPQFDSLTDNQEQEDHIESSDSSELNDSLEPNVGSNFETYKKNDFKPEYPIADIVTLEQSSRITRDELTYLDHPNMGVIVLVSKYETPEEDIKKP